VFAVPWVIVCFILFGILVPWNTGCTDCDLYYEMFIAIFVTLAIVTAPLLPLIVRFLKIRDPSGVMLELKFSTVFVTLLLVGWSLLAGNVDGLETGSIGTWEYMVLFGVFGMWFVWTPMQIGLAFRDYRARKMAKDVHPGLRRLSLDLVESMTDDGLFHEFETFTESFFMVEGVKFLHTSTQWKAVYYERTPAQRALRAKTICKVFFSSGGSLEINISDATKSTVQVRIAQQDIDVRMFDQAIKEVSDMYKYTVWKDFLQRRNHDPRIGLAVVDVPF